MKKIISALILSILLVDLSSMPFLASNSSDSAIKGSDFSFHFADGSTTPILQIIKDFGNSEYMSDFRKKQSNGKAQRNIFENYLKNANHTKLNQKEIDSALQVLSLETNKKSGAKKHKK